MRKLRVFIASPGDVSEERDIVSNVVVPELQRIFSTEGLLNTKDFIELEAVRWETHAWPDIGDDAQDVINKEITDYDLLVGIMWKRFGTPTKRSSSGTGEEFERAYEFFKAYQRPKVMFYFRTTPFYTPQKNDLAQFQKVVNFRSKLQKLGVLFWEYDSPLHFERNVREHLLRQIIELTKSHKNLGTLKGNKTKITKGQSKGVIRRQWWKQKTSVFLSYARSDLPRVRPVSQALREAGFDVWLDVESLLPGQDWNLEIRKALKNSDFVLVLFSEHSMNREGYFQKEIKLALDVVDESPEGSIYLIPVRLESVEIPERLRKFQWIDYFVADGLERLIRSLRKH